MDKYDTWKLDSGLDEKEYCEECDNLEEECTCTHIDWEDRFQETRETY